MSDMHRKRKLIWNLATANYQTNGRGTPNEDLVRQATVCGLTEEAAEEALHSLRLRGDAYQIHPGLIVPVQDARDDYADDDNGVSLL